MPTIHPVSTSHNHDAVYAPIGSTGGITVQDEGAPLTARGTINFTGDGVSAADDAVNERTNVTITGGGVSDHGDLTGLADDDHTQYLNTTRHDTTDRHSLGTVVPHDDHGALSGLADDDHPQYVKHSLATAVSDFLVASGAGAFVKKTLAEVKTILGLGSAAYTASTDYLAANGKAADSDLLDNHDSSYFATADHNHAGVYPGIDGWIPVSATWTYASATTITVPSGAASIYSVGDKFKLTANSVVLQGYIVTVADTLLTVAGNALTSHTFSACYYSKAATPLGFPVWFIYTPTGVSATNVTLYGRFSVSSRMCYVDIYATFAGAITFTTMPTLPIPASVGLLNAYYSYSPSGEGGYYDAGATPASNPKGLYPSVAVSGTTVSVVANTGALMSATVPITWANGDAFIIHFHYQI